VEKRAGGSSKLEQEKCACGMGTLHKYGFLVHILSDSVVLVVIINYTVR